MIKLPRSAAWAAFFLSIVGSAQSHRIPATDTPNTWTGVNTYTQSPQVPTPVNPNDAVPKNYVDTHSGGGGSLPMAHTVISGKGDGNGVAMPEKGTVALISNGPGGSLPHYLTTSFPGTAGNPLAGTTPEVYTCTDTWHYGNVATTWSFTGGGVTNGSDTPAPFGGGAVIDVCNANYVYHISFANTGGASLVILRYTDESNFVFVNLTGGNTAQIFSVTNNYQDSISGQGTFDFTTLKITVSGASVIVSDASGATLPGTIPTGANQTSTKLGFATYAGTGAIVSSIEVDGLVATTTPCDATTPAGQSCGIVSWDEDYSMGRYDARNPKYAGGIYGTNPTAAFQAVENQINCDMSMGIVAQGSLYLPPGTFNIGNIMLAPGSYLAGVSDGQASKTTLSHAWSHGTMLYMSDSYTTTCSDGQQHTNGAIHGKVEHLDLHGCGEGGCTNAPGDTGSYPAGYDQTDTGLDIQTYQGDAEWIEGDHFGGTAIRVGGVDSQAHHLFTLLNNEWYYFGRGVIGSVPYNPYTDTVHGDVEVGGVDGQYDYIETYGTLNNPGDEYGHICGITTGGGDSSFSHLWPQLNEIGICQPYAYGANNRFYDLRVDFSMGVGISVGDTSLLFFGGLVDGSCQSAGIANGVDSFVVTNAGAGYTSQPNVTISGGGGTGATAVAYLNQDGTLLIVVASKGSGFTGVPTVTIDLPPAGGTQASATANINYKCNNISSDGLNAQFIGMQTAGNSGFGQDNITADWYTPYAAQILAQTPTATFQHSNQDNSFEVADTRDFDESSATVTGPAPDVSIHNHIVPTDSSPITYTSLTNVFSQEDIWIAGGNPNVTFQDVSNGGYFQTCSGHNQNDGPPGWTLWRATKPIQYTYPATVTEVCPVPDRDYWPIDWDSNTAPSSTDIFSSDVFGTSVVRQVPLVAPTVGSAGMSPGPHNYCYKTVATVYGEPWTPPLACTQVTPVPSVPQPNPQQFILLTQTLPTGWETASFYLATTDDSAFTPGLLHTFTPDTFPGKPVTENFVYNTDTTTPSGSVPPYDTINGTGGYRSTRECPEHSNVGGKAGDFVPCLGPSGHTTVMGLYAYQTSWTWYGFDGSVVSSF